MKIKNFCRCRLFPFLSGQGLISTLVRDVTSKKLRFYVRWCAGINVSEECAKCTMKKKTFVHSGIFRNNSYVFCSKGKGIRGHSLEMMQFLLNLGFKNLFSLHFCV